METDRILADMQAKFKDIYHGENAGFYFAPGRVNLIGEHTDYNGGHVFPCALTLGTYALAKKREDRTIRMASMNIDDAAVEEFTIDDCKEKIGGRWTDYPKGVIWAFAQEGHGIDSGFDILYYGDIPTGSGLSSSASLEVLTGLVLKSLFEMDGVEWLDFAKLGQKAESDFVGMKCGIMDQFASAMGKADKAMFLDTQTLEYEYLPLELEGAKIVITNSLVKHELASSGYNTRRSECEEALRRLQAVSDIKSLGELTPEEFDKIKGSIGDETLEKRAKHAVYENARTLSAVKVLRQNDVDAFGKLMNESHVSLRDDYEVSCEEIDALVDMAWQIDGVIGSRITGGGFGGCSVSIVKDEAILEFEKKLGDGYEEKYGKRPEFYIVEPGDGASIIKKPE